MNILCAIFYEYVYCEYMLIYYSYLICEWCYCSHFSHAPGHENLELEGSSATDGVGK